MLGVLDSISNVLDALICWEIPAMRGQTHCWAVFQLFAKKYTSSCSDKWFCFQNQVEYFWNTLILQMLFRITKIDEHFPGWTNQYIGWNKRTSNNPDAYAMNSIATRPIISCIFTLSIHSCEDKQECERWVCHRSSGQTGAPLAYSPFYENYCFSWWPDQYISYVHSFHCLQSNNRTS